MKSSVTIGAVAAITAAVAAATAVTRGGSALAPATRVAAVGASNPTAAEDARGVRYVAWVGTGGGASNVYLARADGDAFAAPVRVNDVAGDAAPHEQAPAQVAVGPRGEVYVVWQNNREIPGRRFPASDLRLARSMDGGRTFAPAVTVNDDAGGAPSSHTFHNIVVGKDGTVWVSWLDSRVRDAERARRHPHPAAVVGRTSGDSTKSMHGHGGVAEDPTLPGSEIRVARSTDGGRTFGPGMVVDAGVCPCCRTSLAAAPDGSIYVAWRKVYPGDVRDPVVARLAPGATAFAAPVRVHADGWVFPGCPHAGPSLAVDARGRVHVAWYTGKDGRQGLWYAASDDSGRTFGAPAALLTSGWVPPSHVTLAAEGDHVWATWDDRREQESRVTLASMDRGRPHVIARERAARSPVLATGPRGLLVAWQQGQTVRASAMR